MRYAYLGANAISFALWLVLFWRFRHLRKMMLTMSVLALPLALFDLVFVPSYWKPVTLFGIPVGIEGFCYAFSTGGVAAVLYAAVARRVPRAMPGRPSRRAWLIPPLTFVLFALLFFIVPDPEIAADVALIAGMGVILYLRRDLERSVLIGALAFGLVYFAALKLWVTLFPGAHAWFTFQGLPKVFVWDVPGWEALFGFVLAAYWVNLYEVLFNYRLVRAPRAVRR